MDKKPGQPEFTSADVELILNGLYKMEREDDRPDKLAFMVKTLPERCCEDEEHVKILQKVKADMLQKEAKMRKERTVLRKKCTFLKYKLMVWQDQIKNLPEFTTDELDFILDSLYTLEEDGGDLPEKLEMFLKNLNDDDEDIHRIKCEMTDVEGKLRQERKIRRERITLLKAKIIQTQQDYAIDRLSEPDELSGK